jgi:mRNA-degrading endonuclease toxin of MazEF toxin-antitoxin module
LLERGDVCWADLPSVGRKPVLVVSARVVTLALRSIVVRITSLDRERPIPTAVELADGEVPGLPRRSWVVCHDPFALLGAEDLDPIGRLTPRRMVAVEDALRFALALPAQ